MYNHICSFYLKECTKTAQRNKRDLIPYMFSNHGRTAHVRLLVYLSYSLVLAMTLINVFDAVSSTVITHTDPAPARAAHAWD